MAADPVVSPADTIRRLRLARVPCPEPGCTRTLGHASKVTENAYGQVLVAPCPGCRGRGSVPDPAFDDAVDAALLAVGERDRRQIARLTEALEQIAKGELWTGDVTELAAAVLADEEDAQP